MWDKFGEFDSVEELNAAAAGQKEEEDEEALIALAVENGLAKEDAQDYMDGIVEELASPLMAAQGKIKIESAELKPTEIMEDWVQYILMRITESQEMARAVRRKGKSLEGCIAALLMWSFKHQNKVDQKIMKAAGVTAGRCTLGIPGMATAKKIITNYYLGK